MDLIEDIRTLAERPVDFGTRRPPGPTISLKVKKYPEGASDKEVNRVKVLFDYKPEEKLLAHLRRQNALRKKRGTNVSYEVKTSKNGRLYVELRSGFFNGRGYSVKSVARKVSKVIQDLGMVLGGRTAVELTLDAVKTELDLSTFHGLVDGQKDARKKLCDLYKKQEGMCQDFMWWTMRVGHDFMKYTRKSQ